MLDEIRTIHQPFSSEYQRACNAARAKMKLDPPNTVEVINLEDYRKLLKAALKEAEFPSENHLALQLRNIERAAKEDDFKAEYPPGDTKTIEKTKNCLAYFPLDGNGYPVQDYRFSAFKRLIVLSDGLTYGFTPLPAYYYGILPAEIQECSFVIPEYADDFPFPATEEVAEIQTRFEKAYRKLMEVLG